MPRMLSSSSESMGELLVLKSGPAVLVGLEMSCLLIWWGELPWQRLSSDKDTPWFVQSKYQSAGGCIEVGWSHIQSQFLKHGGICPLTHTLTPVLYILVLWINSSPCYKYIHKSLWVLINEHLLGENTCAAMATNDRSHARHVHLYRASSYRRLIQHIYKSSPTHVQIHTWAHCKIGRKTRQQGQAKMQWREREKQQLF